VNLDFWKKTGQIRPFKTVEQFEKFEEDLMKLPSLKSFTNTPLKKSTIRRGVNIQSEKFDSFFEFIFITYKRKIEFAHVERNCKSQFLFYTDAKGKSRKFYPDFIVNGMFYEVKGQFRENDRRKMEQCAEVTWVFKEDIQKMEAELDSAFGKSWRSEFIDT
jgi:hypothetical protein